MTIIRRMERKLNDDVNCIKDELLPENLALWYYKITEEAVDMAPPWLQDKIKVHQDPVLPMKFKLDISKRAIKYFIIATENNMDVMPLVTKIYFLKLQEAISAEMDKSLI